MLVGKCTKCGKRYIGWALSRPEHQACLECGGRLVVRNMSEDRPPDTETAVNAQRNGIAEWQEVVKNKTPHFML
jgi:DNA-directed RNA polymerase subunit RPC12/RpoP